MDCSGELHVGCGEVIVEAARSGHLVWRAPRWQLHELLHGADVSESFFPAERAP